ncbi:MAG: hypothetical protein ACLS28_19160 [Clostridium neonatale]
MLNMKIRKITKIDRIKRNMRKMNRKNIMYEFASEIIDIGEVGFKKNKENNKKVELNIELQLILHNIYIVSYFNNMNLYRGEVYVWYCWIN